LCFKETNQLTVKSSLQQMGNLVSDSRVEKNKKHDRARDLSPDHPSLRAKIAEPFHRLPISVTVTA
jgi:hypothetical protein